MGPLFEFGFPESNIFPKFIEGDITEVDLLINPAFVNAEIFSKGRNVKEGLITTVLCLKERFNYLSQAMGDKTLCLLGQVLYAYIGIEIMLFLEILEPLLLSDFKSEQYERGATVFIKLRISYRKRGI